MCFAIPLKIKKIKNRTAEMEDGRLVRLGSLDQVRVGDYLEVYADLAVNRLKPNDAQQIRRLIKRSQ